jgi:hypothetical protein
MTFKHKTRLLGGSVAHICTLFKSLAYLPAQSKNKYAASGKSHQVGAAPHCPAGHFSPYRDGEKGAFAKDFANLRRCTNSAEVGGQPSPSLYGAKVPAGR